MRSSHSSLFSSLGRTVPCLRMASPLLRDQSLRAEQQLITMRLDRDTVAYFKDMAEGSGIPYQTLINLYLRDCAANHRKLKMKWTAK